ncbi:MAG TPA: hypothetical protein VF017_15330 [Thermoanaerobaculia bacterium]|nr:hypothetical protein [Thermoanaerobaculia bacterium]
MSDPKERAAADISRVLKDLSARLERRAASISALERAAGVGRGYFRDFLTRAKPVKLEALLTLLYVAEIPPAELFGSVWEDLPGGKVEGGLTWGEIQARVENLVERAISTHRKDESGEPPEQGRPRDRGAR